MANFIVCGASFAVCFYKLSFYWDIAIYIHFDVVCGCFCSAGVELSSQAETHGLQSLKHLLSGPNRKSLLTPTLLQSCTCNVEN